MILPRDVLKWLQSLDISIPVRNPKRDLSNGYAVAEIFSWYYRKDVSMHSFTNGNSFEAKRKNWVLLEKIMQDRNLNVPAYLIEDTIHMKPDAAEFLIQIIYNRLTNRVITVVPPDHEIDFTDHSYQLSLPLHARATASRTVKNNIKITEAIANPNEMLLAHKAQTLINNHIQMRQDERTKYKERFGIRETLGEKCLRHPPSSKTTIEESSNKENREANKMLTTNNVTEINVRQPEPKSIA